MHEDRVAVRQSTVHGRGVIATGVIEAGDEIITYGGEIITWDEAQERRQRSDAEAGHTFFFDIGDDMVVDGGSGGNEAGFINHGCEPNCEAVDVGGEIVIVALRTIRAGEELLFDYQLQLDENETITDEDRRVYACRCGAPSCRGVMLADGAAG